MLKFVDAVSSLATSPFTLSLYLSIRTSWCPVRDSANFAILQGSTNRCGLGPNLLSDLPQIFLRSTSDLPQIFLRSTSDYCPSSRLVLKNLSLPWRHFWLFSSTGICFNSSASVTSPVKRKQSDLFLKWLDFNVYDTLIIILNPLVTLYVVFNFNCFMCIFPTGYS